MIEIFKDTVEVHGFNHAIRGVRNNHDSWDKSDTSYEFRINTSPEKDGRIKIGDNDLKLLKKLAVAGGSHAKYMRYIIVYFDINAPMYWWKEFDTYKVGTVRNSCSTMNSVMKKPFSEEDFSLDHIQWSRESYIESMIAELNELRRIHLEAKEHINSVNHLLEEEHMKGSWYSLIQVLPSSYMTKSTIMLNYQVLRNIYHNRRNHKLQEWHTFCDWIETLPYSELITCTKEDLQ